MDLFIQMSVVTVLKQGIIAVTAKARAELEVAKPSPLDILEEVIKPFTDDPRIRPALEAFMEIYPPPKSSEAERLVGHLPIGTAFVVEGCTQVRCGSPFDSGIVAWSRGASRIRATSTYDRLATPEEVEAFVDQLVNINSTMRRGIPIENLTVLDILLRV